MKEEPSTRKTWSPAWTGREEAMGLVREEIDPQQIMFLDADGYARGRFMQP
jgi:hypothetical protein